MRWKEALYLIPEHMKGGVIRYIEDGIEGGGFMTAVFENNLVEAFLRADHINRANMVNWVEFVYHHAPLGCWGSPENVRDWISIKGIKGAIEVAKRGRDIIVHNSKPS